MPQTVIVPFVKFLIFFFKRNFVKIKPFLWFLATIAVCSLYDLAFLTVEGLLMALIKGGINGYFFYVVYSLYVMLQNEPQRKRIPEV